MSLPSWRKTITPRDRGRGTVRPVAPQGKLLLAASFERLSEESRYRRFLTTKDALSAAELDYLADVDHSDHEAIIAVDPSSGEGLGVAATFARRTMRRSPRSRSPWPTTGRAAAWAAPCLTLDV